MKQYVVDSKGGNAKPYNDKSVKPGDELSDGDAVQIEQETPGNSEGRTAERKNDIKAERTAPGDTDYVGSKGSASQQRKDENGELEKGTEKRTQYRTKWSDFSNPFDPFANDPRMGGGRTRGR